MGQRAPPERKMDRSADRRRRESRANLATAICRNRAALAEAIRHRDTAVSSTELEAALQALDADLAKLREQRATAPFALDRMLPFWALVFNLREVAQDLRELESTLPELIAGTG